MAESPKCPVHGIPDCSPLLNGCTWRPVEVTELGSAEVKYVDGFDVDNDGQLVTGPGEVSGVEYPRSEPYDGPKLTWTGPSERVPAEVVIVRQFDGKVVGTGRVGEPINVECDPPIRFRVEPAPAGGSAPAHGVAPGGSGPAQGLTDDELEGWRP